MGSLATRIGERPMAGKTESAIGIWRKRRLVSQQMDMFAGRVVLRALDWPDLPRDAQEALLGLMTRLILEHARATAAPTMAGGGHDQPTRSALMIWSARRSSTCASPRPTRCCTIARAGRCNTPCGIEVDGAGFRRDRSDRRRSRPPGGRRRATRRFRTDGGCRGLPRQGRRGLRSGSLAFRPATAGIGNS